MIKPFCIYFPQFYPTKVNDEVWGDGFTDWVLVANANMHKLWNRRAPKRGFYDGSKQSIHVSQINEMRQAGLGGVAVYHYWFFNHKELSAFEETLMSTDFETNFPWFLIWATESWSKRWIGDGTEIITLTANPTDEEINQHCAYLIKCFNSPNYCLIDDRPLFVFYNLAHFLNPEDTVRRYRNTFLRLGVNPILGQFIKNPFDAVYAKFIDINYLFEPRLLFGFNNVGKSELSKKIFDLTKAVFGKKFGQSLLVLSDKIKKQSHTYSAEDYIFYRHSAERTEFVSKIGSSVQEVISPGWNNIPRHGNRFTALANLSPDQFISIVLEASGNNHHFPPLINAWNEWSEGASIEPCVYMGSQYLDALSKRFAQRDT